MRAVDMGEGVPANIDLYEGEITIRETATISIEEDVGAAFEVPSLEEINAAVSSRTQEEAVAEGAETSASEGQQPDPDETAESPAEESEQTGEQVLAAQVADEKDAVVTMGESEPDAESSVPEGSTEDGGDDAVESGDES